MQRQDIATRVKRWDVFDVADELADVPGIISREGIAPAVEKVHELLDRLWEAAEREGSVGPWPDYQTR